MRKGSEKEKRTGGREGGRELPLRAGKRVIIEDSLESQSRPSSFV